MGWALPVVPGARWGGAVAQAALIALVLVGCGGAENEPAARPSASPSASPSAPAVPPLASPRIRAPEVPTPEPGGAVPPPKEPAYESIVLVTIDTLRADHLESYGYARRTAPFFEQLATQGVLFENAFASVSHTAPSHATMLTGLPPRVHGVRRNGNKLKDDFPALPGLLRQRGFASGAFLGAGFLNGIARGFDHLGKVSPTATQEVDQAIAWTRAQSGPVFLWLHLYEPHRWRYPNLPEWTREEVVASWKGEAEGFYDYIAGLHGFPAQAPDAPFALPWKGGDGKGGVHQPGSRQEVVEYIDAYDGLIRFADAEVQRLYQALAELGRTKALWIVTSDHGEGLGSHGYEGHGGRIFNEQLHAVLLLHAADGSLERRRVQSLVGHMDLVPTLAELCGFAWHAPDERYLGRSLVPLLSGPETGFPQRFAFAEQRRAEQDEAGDAGEMVALQDARHKLIRGPDGEESFFALGPDPLEQNDLGADARESELRAALEQRLQAFERLASGGLEEPAPEFLQELQDLGYAR